MVTVLILPAAAPKNSLTVVKVNPTVLENSSLLIIIIKQYPETLHMEYCGEKIFCIQSQGDRRQSGAEQPESLNFNALGKHVAYKGAF